MKKIGVLGLMAALAVTGAVAFLPKGVMAAEDSDQTISQGVYIGDVDVSGMTQEEAKKAVEDGMSEAKAANITLKVDDQEIVVSAGDLGLSWANEEVVQEAAELGKSGNIIKRYKDKKDLENESRKYDIDYSVDRSSIQKVLEEKEDVFNREPTDAQLSTENGAFEVVQGENGIELNVEKSVKKILKSLKTDWDGKNTTIELAADIKEPECTTEDLASITDVLGTATTYYGSTTGRNKNVETGAEKLNGHKVAVIGSGPAGLTCAGDLAKLGYDVTIFEALHKAGGVLSYGIPEFRLPKDKVVAAEIENVKSLGVKIETNVIIGKSVTIDELLKDEGFEAVFIGSGAGLPMFMGIPGENANGVFSANEFLTRNNLMKAFRDDYDTPIAHGKKVAVVGGGNVAMDAARTALRLGAEVHVIYRRSEAELPARAEEVHHAKEEGIIFDLLTNPVEILTDDKDWVTGIRCIRMELGEPDASGRRRPVEIPGSEFEIEVDEVIMSLGTSPNPLISSTTKGLETNRRKCIVAEEENGQTSKEGVFAGGDAVTGAATVILAMGAGKSGAKGIDEYLRNK